MTNTPPSEPSMDEILASIRKIISADAKEDTHPFFPPHEAEDVLDLIDVLPEDLEKTQNPSRSPEFHLNDLGEWSPYTNKADYFVDNEITAQKSMDRHPIYDSTGTDSFEEPLLSQTTMSEASQAFQELNKIAQEQPKSLEGAKEHALENLMKEMLKPLLKEWLDAHLPSLVRSVINQQVEKIVGQAGRKDR